MSWKFKQQSIKRRERVKQLHNQWEEAKSNSHKVKNPLENLKQSSGSHTWVGIQAFSQGVVMDFV